MKLADRVAIVTGGGRGIGRAIAIMFAQEGAKVVVTARSVDEIEDAARQITEQGGEAIAVRCDISNEHDVANLLEETMQKFGQVDILVNNAAANLPNINVVDIPIEEWRNVINVNINGPYLCARAVLPPMIARKSGKIINISSIGGRKGARGRGPYRASKAALINFTETLAAEVYEHGVNVNCICPGGVATEMMLQITHGQSANSDLMHPDEIANVALFLASDESSAVTGAIIDAFGQTNPIFR